MKTRSIRLPLSAMAFTALLGITACSSEEGDDEEESSGGTSGQTLDSYDYEVTCPSGAGGVIPIFPGTAECQDAAEFYADTYSCNNIDDFAEADARICDACGANSPIPCS